MGRQRYNDKKKKKEKLALIMRICFIILISIFSIILQSFLGNNSSFGSYIVAIIIIISVIFSIFFIISGFVLYVLNFSDSKVRDIEQGNCCKYYNAFCCVNLAIDSLKSAYRIRLDDNVASKYGLYSEEQLIEKESNIEKGEVWIVSYDLTPEALENHRSRIRKMNIKKGIKYRLFYINDNTQKYGELYDNIKILDERFDKKMKLYPYEKPISIFSFLFSLFGIIMFTDENGMVKEAFFALYSSNDKIKEPIYIKMSYCMERKYNKILFSIKNTAINPRIKQHNSQMYRVKKQIKKNINFINSNLAHKFSLKTKSR